MKEGWEIKALGEIVDILDSQRKPITKRDRIPGEYPYFGATGILDYVHEYIFSEKLILIGEDGAKWNSGDRSAFIVDGKYWVNNHAHVVRPNRDTLIDVFLTYFLNFSDLTPFVSGMTVPKLNQKNLRNIQVPLPPLPEQKRIVSILDEAFAAIDQAKANAEQNLQNAKELFESYLQGVFENRNWDKKRLRDVAKDFGRGKSKHRPRNWDGLYGGDYPFIQTGEVRNANKFITNYKQTYNEVGLAQSKLWKKGTICITIAANIAETAILDFDACIPDSIIGFKVDNKKADLNFAYYLLQYFKGELQKLGKGSAQDNINLRTFENQYFPFSSIEEQQTIVRQLDALRTETQKLEAVYQKKLDDLEELKKSILQKAFAGNLPDRQAGLMQAKNYDLHDESLSLAAEPTITKSRRDAKIIENKINQTKPNPEGVK